jgi:hypothetical protein
MYDVFYLNGKIDSVLAKRVASLSEAQQLSRTRFCWVLDYLCDYTQFDFLWEPPPWQAHQAHVWPSQHQSNSGTWLLPKQPYTEVNREHDPVPRDKSAPRVHIKHCASSPDAGDANTRYISDYLGTLRRALSKVDWEYCWVTADVCDYQDFDFTWHPSEWQLDMLHVFASDEQKFGDTFYVHVPSFLEKSENLALLEWFDTIHFVEDRQVKRHKPPVVIYETDSVVSAVWAHEFRDPVVEFSRYNQDNLRPSLNLWRQETKAVIPLRHGAESVLIPREVKNFLKTQIYDYPVIDKTWNVVHGHPLDIVFISNGEYGADHHWEILQSTVNQPRIHANRLHRVDGVNGRVAAYQSAAEKSQTDWFFAVFAKLQINDDFDWSWQPDRLQEAKHYIFQAYNPVNGLAYGHQAMIAYNRRLVLENAGEGLDFTLDQAHEVVPIISGTAYYDNDPWTCWRTAFREALKLRHSLPDVENEYRLDRWLTVGNGPNGRWSTQGAQDAMQYYEEVDGEFAALKKSYEWDWLASYAMLRHPMLFTESKT